MDSTIQTITLLLAAAAMMTGCRNPLPCPDCDDQAEAVDLPHEDEDPLPDLPCGGADFMTDSYNCGSCGNKCPLWLEGTDWEAGHLQPGRVRTHLGRLLRRRGDLQHLRRAVLEWRPDLRCGRMLGLHGPTDASRLRWQLPPDSA